MTPESYERQYGWLEDHATRVALGLAVFDDPDAIDDLDPDHLDDWGDSDGTDD
jgi:hypothetical protein